MGQTFNGKMCLVLWLQKLKEIFDTVYMLDLNTGNI